MHEQLHRGHSIRHDEIAEVDLQLALRGCGLESEVPTVPAQQLRDEILGVVAGAIVMYEVFRQRGAVL